MGFIYTTTAIWQNKNRKNRTQPKYQLSSTMHIPMPILA